MTLKKPWQNGLKIYYHGLHFDSRHIYVNISEKIVKYKIQNNALASRNVH